MKIYNSVINLISYRGKGWDICDSVSLIGMKSKFVTVFNSNVFDFESIYISAGKLGYQIELSPKELVELIDAKVDHIVKWIWKVKRVSACITPFF